MIYHDKQLSKTIFMKLYTIILINECLRKLNNKLVFKNILNIVNNIFRAGIIILKVFFLLWCFTHENHWHGIILMYNKT